MKIWQQGLLILGLPLLTEIGFCTYLVDNLQQLDRAALQESRAKQILGACQEIRLTMLRLVTMETARRFVSLKESLTTMKDSESLLVNQMEILKRGAAANPKAMLPIEKYCDEFRHFKEVFFDAVAGVAPETGKQKAVMTRYLNEREYMEELFLSIAGIGNQEQEIRKIFAPIAEELQPDIVKRRKGITQLIEMGVLSNVMLAVVLGLLLGQKTLFRLATLMTNIQLFAEHKPQLIAVQGNDELAELDRKFQEMANQRNRAEEFRNTLLEMMTHDIRSPLSSAMITLEMVLMANKVGDVLTDKTFGRLTRLNAEMRRLLRMADGILSVGKIECGRFELNKEESTLGDIVAPSIDAIRGIADSKHVRIETDYAENEKVVCDADKIIQILVNLMSNSLKFAPAKSTVRVSITTTGQTCRFEVTDQGPGVPAELQKDLFQRFVQLEQPSDVKKLGTGLGLYICALLVESHNGSIGTCNSAEGGACFWFEIPFEIEK